ncbi:MAG: superoxide dismutase [Candidatus Liptonbacteria bacterium RIFCSPHIGHO2_01_FULL_57_28]|uniref:Superoxide dismutase n=1 Tax=Candidatus Liptonbacteria bacterium RIFCSPHIGHO2_01_FULL_57_28 TaxID=1798647 RepID=A0A1G2CBD2_9BACT|nr:MAG: superoxide dismutase [Candidatus Liptonbacteria bacterium RIFCSPHIGHO2_01_FULL_57_28]
MKHTLPELPYAYDALEPFIDTETMKLHHGKHHQAYVDKLNEALAKHANLDKKPLEEILVNLEAVPEDVRTAVRNHGGGHLNHSMFWKMLAPQTRGGGAEPQGDLATAIVKNFGGFADLKAKMKEAATKVFGSGWTWLVLDDGKLAIISTPLQDNPISQGKKAVLGIDVWEHAYYLKYQNRRAEYIDAWWNVVNWEEAGRLFEGK